MFGITVYDFFSEKKESQTSTETEPSVQNVQEAEVSKVAQESEQPATVLDKVSEEKISEESEEAGAEDDEEKLSFIQKIKKFVETLKQKIVSFIQKIKDIRDKGLQLKEKVTYYYNIWQQDYTQRAFKQAQKTLFKLWKSIRPKKGILKFHFGTGDPGNTGQICGYFGMLYPFIGKYVMIEPDFENKIYEGDFYFKGYITVFQFLKVAWVVLFDKDIKKLRKILMNSDKEESYDK